MSSPRAGTPPINVDGFEKSPISALREIPQNFTYDQHAAFFVIARALILAFLQSRPSFFRSCYCCSQGFPCNRYLGSNNFFAIPAPKKPSDHFRGPGDYPLATGMGRCQLLRLDKPHPENSLRSDIQGAWLVFAPSWHAPSQLLTASKKGQSRRCAQSLRISRTQSTLHSS